MKSVSFNRRLGLPRNGRTAAGGRGFTLLEVILALGILASSLAVIVEVTRLAHRNANRAALEGDATIVADSLVAQLTTGVLPLMETSGEWIDDPAGSTSEGPVWKYQVGVAQTQVNGLLRVVVRVEQLEPPPNEEPIAVEIVRWMTDPDWLTSRTG